MRISCLDTPLSRPHGQIRVRHSLSSATSRDAGVLWCVAAAGSHSNRPDDHESNEKTRQCHFGNVWIDADRHYASFCSALARADAGEMHWFARTQRVDGLLPSKELCNMNMHV